MRVLTSAQMREADRRTIDELGVPSLVLMENAGRQVISAIESVFPALNTMRVAVICGRGNNGGDGFVVSRTLLNRGVNVATYLVGSETAVTGDARVNLAILGHLGHSVVTVLDEAVWQRHSAEVHGADLVVDAIFGTGFKGAASGLVESVIRDLNTVKCPVVAVDLPTGLSADTAAVAGPAIKATLTVTLAAPKVPLVAAPAAAYAGRLIVADIGIPPGIIDALDGPRIELLTEDAMRALVRPRAPDSNKGTYGRVLIVAGSTGRTGAAYLGAMAALRSGAGLVTVATPESAVATVAALGAEYMTLGLHEDASGALARDALDQILAFDANIVAVGPGLGQSPAVSELVCGLVQRTRVPLVVDADALNVLAPHIDILHGREGVDIIITPHPGEMSRLVGQSIDAVQAARIDVARTFAAAHHVHVVLKGYRTVIAAPDGRVAINPTGNPGMATGGTGDVLVGVIAAWFGQLRDADHAACLGVFLHGLAGDLAARDHGEVGLIAGDLVPRLGGALSNLIAPPKRSGR